MSFITRIWRSSLGKKYVMAITGFVMLLFLVVHMLGNLMIFLGPENINTYGNFLQSTPEILWFSRLVLLVAIVLHFVSSAQLTLENKSSRPTPYANYDVVAASIAARTMIVTGFIILFFVIYHLMHFTIKTPGINLTGQDFHTFNYMEGTKTQHDIFRMMVVGFQQPLITAFYLLGVGLLCAHLSHGAGSMFQSLGLKSKYYARFIDRVALVGAILLFLGYASVPVGVLLGWVKLP